jgi:hypothetical protein
MTIQRRTEPPLAYRSFLALERVGKFVERGVALGRAMTSIMCKASAQTILGAAVFFGACEQPADVRIIAGHNVERNHGPHGDARSSANFSV